MADLHKNFAYSTVATAPSTPTAGTTLIVAAGTGALFPTPPFNATVWPAGAQPLTTNSEIVRVTNISTDTLTITRGATSGGGLNGEPNNQNRSIVIGDQIAAGITAKTLTDVQATPTPTASTAAAWDANENMSMVNTIEGYTTTVTSASTVTLTVASNFLQFFTGSTPQTLILPVASTLVLGMQYEITNLSTALLTIEASGGATVMVLSPNQTAILTCILASGTTAASWNASISGFPGAWTAWSPSVTSSTGTITTVGAITARYVQIGKTIIWSAQITITTAGTGAGFLFFTLPVTAQATLAFIGAGREDGVTGSELQVKLNASATQGSASLYSGATAIANGAIFRLGGTYEAA